MSLLERIIHSILFEIGAVLIGLIVLALLGEEGGHALLVMILVSLTAMVWAFVYNWIFDYFVPGDRLARGPLIRSIHALLMEGGLLLATVPIIAYMLDMTWTMAFIADIAMTLVILVYTYIYNWIYDRLRLYFVKDNA